MKTIANAIKKSGCHGNSSERQSAKRCEQQPSLHCMGSTEVISSDEYSLLNDEHLPHILYH